MAQNSVIVTPPSPTTQSLYRRILGNEFHHLPETMGCFHSSPVGGSAVGIVRVTWGKGWIQHLMARLLRLPPPGERVPLRLQVKVEGNRERWIRQFETTILETLQWQDGELLVETAGILRLGLSALCSPGSLRFKTVRCWIWKLPIPVFLAPRVTALAQGNQEGWSIYVQVSAPLLGVLIRYEGDVRPL